MCLVSFELCVDFLWVRDERSYKIWFPLLKRAHLSATLSRLPIRGVRKEGLTLSKVSTSKTLRKI